MGYVDALGYAIADLVSISQETQEKRSRSKPEWLVWVLCLLVLFSFTGYEIYITVESYRYPSWSIEVNHDSTPQYPGVLVCPDSPKPHFDSTLSTCVFNLTEKGGRFSTSSDCGPIQPINITYMNANLSCLMVNFETIPGRTLPVTTAREDARTLITLSLSTRHLRHNLAYLLLLHASERPSAIDLGTPSFVVGTDTLYWIGIMKHEDKYLNRKTDVWYDAIVSSTSAPSNVESNHIVVQMTYASYDVITSVQYIENDWLSLISSIGGAASLISAVYVIVMAIVHGFMATRSRASNTQTGANGESTNAMQRADDVALGNLESGTTRTAEIHEDTPLLSRT